MQYTVQRYDPCGLVESAALKLQMEVFHCYKLKWSQIRCAISLYVVSINISSLAEQILNVAWRPTNISRLSRCGGRVENDIFIAKIPREGRTFTSLKTIHLQCSDSSTGIIVPSPTSDACRLFDGVLLPRRGHLAGPTHCNSDGIFWRARL